MNDENNESRNSETIVADGFNVDGSETVETLLPVYVSKWYEANLPLMPVSVARRHQFDITQKLLIEDDGQKLEALRVCLDVIEKHLDETLPKAPASFEQHDHSIGDRAANNWPEHLHRSTLLVHLHLCELLDSWRINPLRYASSRIWVNEDQEREGLTHFEFQSKTDLNAFIDHYKLADFIVLIGSYLGDSGGYLNLSNKFERDETNKFLETYNACVNRLAIIADERRRAIVIDGGKIGFMTVDHYSVRERNELEQITRARCLLGLGAASETANQ